MAECQMENLFTYDKCISAKIAEKKDCLYVNLERVTIRNEILIRRDFSILNSISHVKHELAMI